MYNPFMDSRANFSREIQKCKFFSVRIFVFINVCLIVSTIRNCKVICTAVTWLAVYGILLFCMIVHGKRNDIKMWIPGISLNRYLIWLVGDPYLLSVLSTGICCTTVLISTVGLTYSQTLISGQGIRTVPNARSSTQAQSESSSLLPPSYSDCESPPPCYSQAINQQRYQRTEKCPTYQEAIETL